MKSIKILFFSLALMVGLSSCSEKWLQHELTGGSITEDELASLGNTSYERVRGLYSLMFQYGGDHQTFGQKSIDIATDILAGDVALTNAGYGYWSAEAQGTCSTQGAGRTAQIWGDNFLIIANANNIIRMLNKAESMSLTDSLALAEAKTIRAYCYFNLAHFFSPAQKDESHSSPYVDLDPNFNLKENYPTCPIYTGADEEYNEENILVPRLLSGVSEVYSFVINDLEDAIALFAEVELKGASRESKLSVDGDVAKVLLSYAYLQLARYTEDVELYTKSYENAIDVINGGKYTMLPYSELTTNGFNDVSNKSWMWGLDVTRENSTGLASFFGQMDIHTYSYAAAGGILGIDKNLYEEIPTTDKRRDWFNPNISYCPENKFFDPEKFNPYLNGTLDGVDRDWLNDAVYMRVEEAYLLAAEAAFRAGNTAEAQNVLGTFLEQRDPTVAAEVKAGTADLEKQLYYNWRVEMWGEGRALMTFKRFAMDTKKRGSNHYIKPDKEMKYNDYNVTFDVPYAEYAYNQALNPETDSIN